MGGTSPRVRAQIFSSYDLVHLWLDNFKAEVKPYIVLIEDRGESDRCGPHVHQSQSGYGVAHQLPDNGRRHVSPIWLWPVRCLCYARRSRGHWRDGELCQEGEVEQAHHVPHGHEHIHREVPGRDNAHVGRAVLSLGPVNKSLLRYPKEGNITANFGKNTRANIQRARNKLEKAGRMDFRKVESVEDAETAMNLYLLHHEERWENKNTILCSQTNRQNDDRPSQTGGKLREGRDQRAADRWRGGRSAFRSVRWRYISRCSGGHDGQIPGILTRSPGSHADHGGQ